MDKKPSLLPTMYLPPPQLGPVKRMIFACIWPMIRGLLKLRGVDKIYQCGMAQVESDRVAEGCLQGAQIQYEFDPETLNRIPAEGPVLVISNHPYGMADGLLQAHIIQSVRSDTMQLVNKMLSVFPELAKRYIFVDPFDSEAARRGNTSPLRDALSWLKKGHLLATFPSGTVSHRTWEQPESLDPAWNPSIYMLAKRSGATVVPIWFEGQNGPLFQWGGLISPKLRTMLIPRYLCSMKGKPLRARIGSPISSDRLREFNDRTTAIEYLRSRVYLLGDLSGDSDMKSHTPQPVGSSATSSQEGPDPSVFESEIEHLPDSQHLCASGDLAVHMASASQIPELLREIGRLREITFRQVGEGTGKEIDLDEYDQTYRHLFVWNTKSREVVGAYRMGLTDEILSGPGIDGFYTRTLFDYDETILDRFGDAIELGRSFIRPEYQKGFKPLMLLWRGISTFAALNRRYRRCFGVVSMSHEYAETSKLLLTRWLMNEHRIEGDLIKARTPWSATKPLPGVDIDALAAQCRSIEDVDELVRDIEPSGMGVPVLVRQYLKLEAKLLAPFNIDRSFADVIDALMLVDFMQVDRRIALFYLGADLANAFRNHHGFDSFEDHENHAAQ